MYDLKQSTALTVLFFAHDVNGDAVNSLTDGSFTKRQSKNGAGFGAMTVTVTFMENGWYSLPLTTSHTDTLGVTTIVLTNAGCKQVNLQFRVHARTNDDLAPSSTALSNATWTDPKAAFLDAAVTSRMATYTQPTGFLAATFPATVADVASVWSYVYAGQQTGLMLYQTWLSSFVRTGQIQGATASTVTLDTGANANNAFYNRTMVMMVTGTGTGQVRLINGYNGTTKVADINRDWVVTPSTNDWYVILSMASVRSASDVDVGVAQSGSLSTIQLNTAASALDNYYNRMFVLIENGTGEGQARLIASYTGTTRTATVARNWITAPDATSRYVILPFGSVKVSDIDADAVNASALSADAVAEIQVGLATSAEIAAVQADTDDIQSRLPAALDGGRMDSIANAVAADAIGDAQLAADVDTYQAKVWVFDDDAGANDRYACVWHKNGQPVTSGITSPTVQVIKASDGTDLVAVTAMTQIGATGLYKYDEGTNRIVSGAAYVTKVQATIDSSTRTWYQPVGRDSSV